MRRLLQYIPIMALSVLTLTGCSDVFGIGGEDTAGVNLNFGTPGSTSSSTASASLFAENGDTLVIEGSNGTLAITDLHFIVEEFELERANVDCDSVPDEDACEKFETPAAFVDLPLSGGSALAVSNDIPADQYEELEFEIERIDGGEDESPQVKAYMDDLRNAVTEQFPNWPIDDASMVLIGTFTPTDGTPQEFKTFARAEVEVELEFEPPLVITEDDTSREVTVRLDPTMWFTLGDGTVVDLSQWDYRTTNDSDSYRFEVELENGFTEIEYDN